MLSKRIFFDLSKLNEAEIRAWVGIELIFSGFPVSELTTQKQVSRRCSAFGPHESILEHLPKVKRDVLEPKRGVWIVYGSCRMRARRRRRKIRRKNESRAGQNAIFSPTTRRSIALYRTVSRHIAPYRAISRHIILSIWASVHSRACMPAAARRRRCPPPCRRRGRPSWPSRRAASPTRLAQSRRTELESPATFHAA